MKLMIGGAGQGKLGYALHKTGLTEADVGYSPQEASSRAIFAGLETWVRETGGDPAAIEKLLEENPAVIILCDEVGCGVVPLLPQERAWREQVGRLCCCLAEKATCVERIFCGLPTVLKGEAVWN